MCKTVIGMYEVVAAKATKEPYRTADLYGQTVVGYRVDEKELKTAFGTNGFNLNRNSWKGYIDTWKECNMILPDINGTKGVYYLSRCGLELIRGGKGQIMALDRMAADMGAEVVA